MIGHIHFQQKKDILTIHGPGGQEHTPPSPYNEINTLSNSPDSHFSDRLLILITTSNIKRKKLHVQMRNFVPHRGLPVLNVLQLSRVSM